ncbi:MAG: RNA methyltransferase [Bryobacteraceae bacterium]
MVERLTSARNPLLKEVRRAGLKGELTPSGACVAESFHLLEEAIRGGCEIDAVLAATSVRGTVEGHVKGLKRVRVTELPDPLFDEISLTEASQGVIALVKPPAWTLDQLFRGRSLVVALDGIQDPGNAGAIVRSAEAFGATGVVFVKGAVSPYNPKTLRASAGSLFRVPFVHGLDAVLLKTAMSQKRVDVFAAVAHGGLSVGDVDLSRRAAIIVGSEAHGVSATLLASAAGLRIPTTAVESLNAAVAASIILYEAARQRWRK